MSNVYNTRRTAKPQDENSAVGDSRITRAKAAAAGGFQYTSLEQVGTTRTRAALGDLSNVGRTPQALKSKVEPKKTVGLQRGKPLGVRGQQPLADKAQQPLADKSQVLNRENLVLKQASKLDSETIRGQEERKRAQALVSVYRAEPKEAQKSFLPPQRKVLGELSVPPIAKPEPADTKSSHTTTAVPPLAKRAASSSSLDESAQVAKRRKLKEDETSVEQPVATAWKELDEEDADDPLTVSEYVVEIFDYLYKLQDRYVVKENYMDAQPDINWNMRDILVDWLIEVHTKFRLLPETLFLAVNIMDRYFSRRRISIGRLQMSGLAALFIASKYEEIMPPSVTNFSYVMSGSEAEDVLNHERRILKEIQYDLSYPNPLNYLRRISKADKYDIQTRTIAKYLLEISLFEPQLVARRPSEVAAGAMFLARLMLQRGDWDANLVHYSGDYPIKETAKVAAVMIDYLVRPVVHESFFKKYASKKFLKASIIARAWAKEHKDTLAGMY